MFAVMSVSSSLRFLLMLLAILLLVNPGYSQQWSGVKKFGSETWAGGAALSKSYTDKEGNTYAVGPYDEKIVLGGIEYKATGLDNNFFLVKLDPNGGVIWASTFYGISLDNWFNVDQLAVDDNGRVYLSGHLNYEAHFENNIKLIMPPTFGDSPFGSSFVCVFNENGIPAWAKFGGGIHVTPEGKIYSRAKLHDTIKDHSWWKEYVMGWHGDSLHCYNSTGTLLRRRVGYWIYDLPDLFKTEGEDLWFRSANNLDGELEFRRYNYAEDKFEDPLLLPPIPVAFNQDMINGSLYFWGHFGNQQTVQIGQLTLMAKNPVNGYYDYGFLVKYDMESKSYVWGRTVWKMNYESVFVGENPSGDVYLASEETGIWSKNNIRAYSAAGDSLWTKQSTSYILWCNGMGTDQYGNIYVVGEATNGVSTTATFGDLSFVYSENVAYWAKINLDPILIAPTNLAAGNITRSSVSLAWQDSSSDETGYRVEYKKSDATIYEPLVVLPPNTIAYTASDLECDITYMFRVIALGDGGPSAPSNTVGITTGKIQAPVIESSATSACVGEEISLTAPSGFVKHYWSTGQLTDGIIVSNSGNFKLVVEDEKQCKSDTGIVTIAFYSYPTVTVVSAATTISLEVQTGDIQWYLNDDPITGETSATITPEESGMYSVSVSNHGCVTFSDAIEFVFTSVEIAIPNDIEIFPIPAQAKLTVRFNEISRNTSALLKLTTMQGKEIEAQHKNPGDDEKSFDTSQLASGLYLLHMRTGTKLEAYKVIVE